MRWFLRMGCAVATLCCAAGASAEPKPAVPIDPASWVTHDDYPVEAIRNGESGTVAVALAIDASGRATGCTVTASSNVAALDAITCRVLMERARFRPATDAAGRPIAATYPRRVHWAMPTDYREPLTPFAAVSRVTIDANGMIAGCETARAGNPVATPEICLRQGGEYPAQPVVSGYGPGVATFGLRQSVEGMDMAAGAATSDMPPKWWREESYIVDAAGAVHDCRVRDSGAADATCGTIGPFEAEAGRSSRRVVRTTSFAFQPAP